MARNWHNHNFDTANMGVKKSGKSTSTLNGSYYTNPKTGFDQKWHQQQANLRAQQEKLARQKAMAMIKANKGKTHSIT